MRSSCFILFLNQGSGTGAGGPALHGLWKVDRAYKPVNNVVDSHSVIRLANYGCYEPAYLDAAWMASHEWLKHGAGIMQPEFDGPLSYIERACQLAQAPIEAMLAYRNYPKSGFDPYWAVPRFTDWFSRQGRGKWMISDARVSTKGDLDILLLACKQKGVWYLVDGSS